MTADLKNNLKINIRDLVRDDLGAVLTIENDIFPDPWTKQMFIDHIEDDGWGGFIAENDGLIIGYACYYIVAGEAHLTNIATRKDFQRKSVAKQLLENILQIASDNECAYVLLEVRPSNLDAIKFYEKYGFKILYHRPEYYHNPVENALVMVRYFDKD